MVLTTSAPPSALSPYTGSAPIISIRSIAFGQQIELHGIAERLVEAATVKIGRKTLRLPLQRREREAAIDEIRLIGIVLSVLQREAGCGTGERLEQVRAAGTGDVITADFYRTLALAWR